MTDAARSDRLSTSGSRGLALLAGASMVLWVVLEFALRRGLVPRLAEAIDSATGADALVLAAGVPLVATLVGVLGIRFGIGHADWDYDLTARTVAAGFAGVPAYFTGYLVLVGVLVVALGTDLTAGGSTGGGTAVPTWALALLVLGNGIAVPIGEELAWRGVIQTALTEAYGPYVGVGVTAIAFVSKHVVVDLAANPFRVASLVVLAFVLGGLRARWGTASSTVAHLGVNLLATGSLVLA